MADNPHNRDISSSEDHCKCAICKDQQQLNLIYRNNLGNIHFYKHLKKRQAPPIKDKQRNTKLMAKIENQKKEATPVKHKFLSPSVQLEYHPVSQSQRIKIVKGELLMEISQVGLRRDQRDFRGRTKIRSGYDTVGFKLAEISENPETIKITRNFSNSNRSSSHHQASPPCLDVERRNSQDLINKKH